MYELQNNSIFTELPFDLCKMVDDKIIRIKQRGAYILVDNGYHHWRVLMNPFTVKSGEAQWRWSKWVESMRKDVGMFDFSCSPLSRALSAYHLFLWQFLVHSQPTISFFGNINQNARLAS